MNWNLIPLIFNARRKSFMAILVLLLANLGLYIYYAYFLEPRVAGLQTRWAEKRLQAAAGSTLDAAAVYRQGKADIAEFRSRIPLKKGFAAFIGGLFETATDNSLQIGTITYRPSQLKGENLIAFSIGFNVSGKYAAIKSFIADIEGMREIAVIDNISLSGKSDEEYVDLRLQMTTYFRVEG
jgi:type IV pilus assembly protein PilO